MATASLSIEIVLDRCLRAIREGSYSLDDCLAYYPVHKEELEPLLLLVLRLQSARTLEAPQEFRNIAITRMNNLIESRPRPSKRRARAKMATLGNVSGFSMISPKNRFSFKSAALVLVALFVILLTASSGVVYAASHAMPGNIFYPIKDKVEMAQLTIFSNDYRDAALYLKFSQQRLEEAEVLIRQQQFGEAKFSLIDYQVEAHSTLANLAGNSPFTDEQRLQLARKILESYSNNEAHLQVFLGQAPDTIRPSVEAALVLTRQVLEQAKHLINMPQTFLPGFKEHNWMDEPVREA